MRNIQPDYIRQQNLEDLDAWYKQHFLPGWKKQLANKKRKDSVK